MNKTRVAAIAAAFFSFATLAARADDPKSLRHLEYKFNVAVSGETTVRDSGIGGGPASGVGSTRTGIGDTGTIVVDYFGPSGDGGVVYAIAENGREERRAPAAKCVVYPNTNVICESDKTVYDEELALLRPLAPNFTREVPLDARHHWQYRESTPSSTQTTDYTVKNDANGVVALDVEDLIRTTGMSAYESKATGGIKYSRTGSIPTWISYEGIMHTLQGSSRGTTNIELTLVSDSQGTRP